MKAVRIYEHGGLNVLKWDEISDPKPSRNQVLIDVKSTSLNHLDIWVRKGIPGVPLPLITGSDAAGVISSVGENVDENRIGQKVMIQPLVFCGHCIACQSGKQNLCDKMGIRGENCQGTNAQKIVVENSTAFPFPNHLNFEQAAAFSLVAQTSYQMILNRAKLKSNECILIWGASSGVGSMAIQIAKSLGALVIAVSGSDKKCEKGTQIGAQYVLNYQSDDIISCVKKITDSKGANVVFEHVGSATWDISMQILARGGRIVTCGATTGNDARINLTHLFFKQQSILGSTMGSKSAFDGALKLLNDGEINPVVDRIFPAQEIASAHQYLESGQQFGKVILTYE